VILCGSFERDRTGAAYTQAALRRAERAREPYSLEWEYRETEQASSSLDFKSFAVGLVELLFDQGRDPRSVGPNGSASEIDALTAVAGSRRAVAAPLRGGGKMEDVIFQDRPGTPPR